MSHTIITRSYQSPVGELILGSYGESLCLCDWKYRKMRNSLNKRISKFLNAEFEEGTSPVIEKTIAQLEEYFEQKRTTFDIPLILAGTDFQQSVWNRLKEIPFGETRTYLQLSQELQNEQAIRAVASANGANAISIIIPCHRVIGSDGQLVGYAGGLQAKKHLLKLEGSWMSQQLNLF